MERKRREKKGWGRGGGTKRWVFRIAFGNSGGFFHRFHICFGLLFPKNVRVDHFCFFLHRFHIFFRSGCLRNPFMMKKRTKR